MNTRRELFTQAGKAAAAAAWITAGSHVHAQGSGKMKIALVGCGGRGTGAASQALTAGSDIELVALGDIFDDKAKQARKLLGDKHQGQVNVADDHIFIGFDAYKKAFAAADVVLCATPPGFRPQHFEEAVRQGKHAFIEKPVATDAHGVRRVLAAAEEAKKKNLNVCVGLQRRYQPAYMETVKRIQDGALGDLKYMRVFWNGSARAGLDRNEGESELAYQLRNWYFYTWLSGDHILEQHVHNLDVAHWVLGKLPLRAQGLGGRQVRKAKTNGQIFDHHFVEFEYDDGVRVFSQCHQMAGKCYRSVSEHAHGTKGSAEMVDHQRFAINGEAVGDRRRAQSEDGHQLEHFAFFENIRSGKVRNDGEYGAKSTLMGIMGRMATYTGQVITMEQAMNSKQVLVPDITDWNFEAPVKPDADGWYPVAAPGITVPA
ncbi:MAG TPA: Gfo/Idh/MocA family oxidoreductase [Verrucomicrobiaceae bacterium]|jgi:predicted dehydrogenase